MGVGWSDRALLSIQKAAGGKEASPCCWGGKKDETIHKKKTPKESPAASLITWYVF